MGFGACIFTPFFENTAMDVASIDLPWHGAWLGVKMAAHPPKFVPVGEALTLIARLWSEEKVTFAGEHFQYHDATIAPRPVQKPMPLWIGGSSKVAIRRTASLGPGERQD